jgi:phospholipid/cholesterol/gamma-HCH transport system substrate-binding protein
MRAVVIKSLVFTLVTVAATAALAATIRNSAGGSGEGYTALFSDATSLNKGDDVRVAGVKVGTVKDIEVADDSVAKVSFTVRDDVDLAAGTTAQLRFRNVVGQRYVALEQPAASEAGGTLKAGHTFGLDETRPALDLTVLFNGFQPLFRLLDPDDVNTLSAQVISVFQGEGATVETLLSSTASLTSTLAEKDQVIGELIDSLSSVLGTVQERSGQLDRTVVTLDRLVTGLAEDRETIGDAADGLGDLAVSVAGLLEDGRAPLKDSIAGLGALAGNLSADSATLDRFLKTLPTKIDRIGRTASYGSWLNFYVCSIEGRIPVPEGYVGDVGAQPVAGRCQE